MRSSLLYRLGIVWLWKWFTRYEIRFVTVHGVMSSSSNGWSPLRWQLEPRLLREYLATLTEQYEFVDITRGDFLEANGAEGSMYIENANEGRLTFANLVSRYEETTVANGEGDIATIRLRWIGDENSPIRIDDIEILDGNGVLTYREDIRLDKPVALPLRFELMDNYPNPFNPETTIRFALPTTESVKIEIVNILGQHVRTLVDNEIKAGVREVKWNSRNDFGTSVSSGIYFYRIKAGTFVSIKKLTLIK